MDDLHWNFVHLYFLKIKHDNLISRFDELIIRNEVYNIPLKNKFNKKILCELHVILYSCKVFHVGV